MSRGRYATGRPSSIHIQRKIPWGSFRYAEGALLQLEALRRLRAIWPTIREAALPDLVELGVSDLFQHVLEPAELVFAFYTRTASPRDGSARTSRVRVLHEIAIALRKDEEPPQTRPRSEMMASFDYTRNARPTQLRLPFATFAAEEPCLV